MESFSDQGVKREEKGAEKFKGVVKKTIRVLFNSLLLFFLFFLSGHWVMCILLSDSHLPSEGSGKCRESEDSKGDASLPHGDGRNAQFFFRLN